MSFSRRPVRHRATAALAGFTLLLGSTLVAVPSAIAATPPPGAVQIGPPTAGSAADAARAAAAGPVNITFPSVQETSLGVQVGPAPSGAVTMSLFMNMKGSRLTSQVAKRVSAPPGAVEGFIARGLTGNTEYCFIAVYFDQSGKELSPQAANWVCKRTTINVAGGGGPYTCKYGGTYQTLPLCESNCANKRPFGDFSTNLCSGQG
jgi:hypothetical protein